MDALISGLLVGLGLYVFLQVLGRWLIFLGKEQERNEREARQREAILQQLSTLQEVYLCPKCLKLTPLHETCQFCFTVKPEEPSVQVVTLRQMLEHNAAV